MTSPAAFPTAADRSAPTTSPQRLARLKAQPRHPGEASFFFFEPRLRSDAVKVLPGEFFVSDDDLLITTTLGSCIAACIWDNSRKVGGMNHFMLPDGPAGADEAGGRYGAFAMDQLIGELVKRGAQRPSMEAKIFGGAAVVEGMTSINVGERNTRFALEYLRTERIPVVSKDVLGTHARKVCFLPCSGKAMVKRLVMARAAPVPAPEHMAAQAAPARGRGGLADQF